MERNSLKVHHLICWLPLLIQLVLLLLYSYSLLVLILLFTYLIWQSRKVWKQDWKSFPLAKVKEELQRKWLIKVRELEIGFAYKIVICLPVGCQNLKKYKKDKMKLVCTQSIDYGWLLCLVKISQSLCYKMVLKLLMNLLRD